MNEIAPAVAAAAAAVPPVAESLFEKKKPARSDKQRAADEGAVAEMAKLKARYNSEFANIDEKFRPKPKFPDARKLFYLKTEADKNEFIEDRLKIDRAAAELRVKGKTRKNANRAAAAEQRLAAKTSRKVKIAPIPGPTTAIATTRRVGKTAAKSTLGVYTSAMETKLHTRLHTIANRVEDSLKKTATRIADDIRKVASGMTATAPKARKNAATAPVATQLPAINEANEFAPTPMSTERNESEYFG
jgi:hypothetical protein